jgi:DNA gyrase subunit A
VANLLAFQPDEKIAQVMDLRDYEVAQYLIIATKSGMVKKTALTDYDSPRSAGLIAISLKEDDEVISARLVSPEDDLLIISTSAQAIRFKADDDQLRPMGRDTRGVIGMRFDEDQEVLGMHVISDGQGEEVLVATEGGYAKRTPADQYPVQGRGGKGVLTAKIVQNRGRLVGALMVKPEDEVFAMTSSGGVIRTSAGEIKQSGRQTMGVRLVNLTEGDVVVAIARNVESIEAIEAVTDAELPDDVVLDTEVLDAEVLDSEVPTDVEPGEEGSERS